MAAQAAAAGVRAFYYAEQAWSADSPRPTAQLVRASLASCAQRRRKSRRRARAAGFADRQRPAQARLSYCRATCVPELATDEVDHLFALQRDCDVPVVSHGDFAAAMMALDR